MSKNVNYGVKEFNKYHIDTSLFRTILDSGNYLHSPDSNDYTVDQPYWVPSDNFINPAFMLYKNGKHFYDPDIPNLVTKTEYFWTNGVHRLTGRPDKEHRSNGKPAMIARNIVCWLVGGKYHRINGPAMITSIGTYSWYINGDLMGMKFYEWAKDHGIDLKNVEEEDAIMIQLAWGDNECS